MDAPRIHKCIELLAYISIMDIQGWTILWKTLGSISQVFMYSVNMDVWWDYWSPNKGVVLKKVTNTILHSVWSLKLQAKYGLYIFLNNQGYKIRQTKVLSLDTLPNEIFTHGWIFSNNFCNLTYWSYWKYYLCTTWNNFKY